MTARDEAIRVIREQTLISDMATAKDVARRLDQAGLFVPDLPGPDECPPDIHTPGWNLGGGKYAGVLAGRVWITDERGWGKPHTPDEIRAAAHKLLAAANSAEGKRE